MWGVGCSMRHSVFPVNRNSNAQSIVLVILFCLLVASVFANIIMVMEIMAEDYERLWNAEQTGTLLAQHNINKGRYYFIHDATTLGIDSKRGTHEGYPVRAWHGEKAVIYSFNITMAKWLGVMPPNSPLCHDSLNAIGCKDESAESVRHR